MNLTESVLVALTALRTNLMRSTLTMLGIIIGVAAVITMVAMGAGAQKKIDDQIAALGTNLFMIMPGYGRDHGARTSKVRLSEDDARAIKNQVPDVVAVAPTIRGMAQVVLGNLNWSTVVQGVDGDYLIARNWAIVDGREFEPREVEGGAKVVLVGATVAKELFGEAEAVGQTIRVNRIPMKVVGVLDAKGQTGFGQDQDDLIMVPIDTARTRLLGEAGGVAKAVQVIMVSVRDAWMMEDVEAQITDILRARHRLQPGQEDTFRVRNMSEMVETRAEASRVFNMLLAAVASVSLVVGGIGIMNIMLVSVTERTREIGLRRAVGAKSRDILVQFLIEAITLCTLGGIIGVLLAVGISVGAAAIAGWSFELQWQVVVLAVLFSAVIGVFFGYYPARRAARQDPIEALRYE
ncbi:MAG: ABC transporter permease [Proteobacteria bacterium]|nr:ABC transporter permease [Pseudomonadota bacterium]